MTDQSDEAPGIVDSLRSTPTLVFFAITTGAVTVLLMLVVFGTVGVVEPLPNIPLAVIRVVGLVLLVSGYTVIGMTSGSIAPLQSGQDRASWWQANSGKAIATWVFSESLAVVGGVLFLLTGDLVLLAGLGGGGLIILLLNRPGRMMEG